jgi:hypothetical protein
VFCVDASGSTAVSRLAEAKGAAELILAQAYVKRADVAVVAFRGEGADVLLPPTRSLTRAKRALAALPGGGGTPLASGLSLARQLGEAVAARGSTPVLVFLTDGSANIALDGTRGRSRAQEDALLAARAIAGAGHDAVVIDISPRPGPRRRAWPRRCARATCPCPVPMPMRCTPPWRKWHERRAALGSGRPPLAAPRGQPLCRNAGPCLACAGDGPGAGGAAAAWHGRGDAQLARCDAPAGAGFHHGCARSARPWLYARAAGGA